MRRILLLLLAFSLNASALELPLSEVWSQHFVNGVDSIQAFDGDGRGGIEVYAISYTPRMSVFVYSTRGEALDDFGVEPKMKYLYPSETIDLALISDVDDDGFIDIIAASEAHSGAINKHILYRLERLWDQDLRKYYTQMSWKHEESDLTTSIHYVDVDGDGFRDLVTSDRDGGVRFFSTDGTVVKQLDFRESIWDMQPAAGAESNETRLVLGMFRKLAVADGEREEWSYGVDTRVSKVRVADVNGDGRLEYIGLSEKTVRVFSEDGIMLWKRDFESVEDLGVMEITEWNYTSLMIASKTKIMFLDGEGNLTWSHDLGEKIRVLKSFNHDGETLILAGTDGSLRYFTVELDYFRRRDAEDYSNAAHGHFKEGEFNKSIDAAVKAITHYTELQDIEAVTELESMVDNATNIISAETLYEKARWHLLNDEYENSKLSADRALEVFQRTGHSGGVEKTMKLISGIGDKKTADSLYNAAEKSYIQGNFQDSVENATAALQLYARINHTDGMRISQSLIDFNLKQLNTTQPAQTTTTTKPTTSTLSENKAREDLVFYGAVGLSILILALTAYYTLGRRR